MVNLNSFVNRRSVGLLVERPELGGEDGDEIQEGYFDYENGGQWVAPEMNLASIQAIVIPAQPDEVEFDQGGYHINMYRKVYTSGLLKKGDKVQYDNKEYTVLLGKDYAAYATGLRVFFIKRTDADD